MRHFHWICVAMVLVPLCASAQEVKLGIEKETILGPADKGSRDAWFGEMKRWREEHRASIKYDDAEYKRKELLWTQSSFVQPQMMVEERYFYDPVEGRYTVDRYLDDVEKRYGGIDSVLIWPIYPNIGIDNRNQLDLLKDMPGGVPGIRKMISDFHRRDVKVFFPIMPWDKGTRPEGIPLWEAAARDMAAVGADGLNGDTMTGLPREYRDASDKTGHIIALEPEGNLGEDAMIMWNTLSWGYWTYPAVPEVSKYKWIEPRHMVHVCQRWTRNKLHNLQLAFFNGVGYESWENVWGIWNGITPRDAETLRRIRMIYRAVPDLLVSADWEPHVPTVQNHVYASRFPGKQRTLWLLVNRGQHDAAGEQLKVPFKKAMTYYDLYSGVELQPVIEGDVATLSLDIEADGYGAVLALDGERPDENLQKLLSQMAERSKQRLDSYSAEWKPLPQKMVEISPTKPANEAPDGMILIPAGKFQFKVSGVMIEGRDAPGVDVQYPWEEWPRRHHDQELEIKAFYIDRYPVTNEQYKKFVDASSYRPKDDQNHLKDWKDGSYPAGWDKKPVTFVSIEDARAYATWAGKRLPHEWEWQYAAQGTDGRIYPWGNEPDDAAVPPFEDGPELSPPSDVDAYPKGASPFGVMDMTGNVWQWTDEFHDEHTRAGILRGGSHYRPKASGWYFPRNTKLSEHGKYLLMAPCKDRSATVGFRCVVDAG